MLDYRLIPAEGASAVTPNDSGNLIPTKGLYIGGTGNVTVRMANGDDNILFASAPAGILYISVTRVYSTGTAATGIVALY